MIQIQRTKGMYMTESSLFPNKFLQNFVVSVKKVKMNAEMVTTVKYVIRVPVFSEEMNLMGATTVVRELPLPKTLFLQETVVLLDKVWMITCLEVSDTADG